MGARVPDSGMAVVVEVEVARGVPDALEVARGVAVDLVVGEAEGVETKAGPSAAWTINVLVMVCRIPLASFQETVIL